jgi:phosphoglycerate kinase
VNRPDVPLLRDRRIVPGERWIYSAGFNVKPDLRETSRIDCELANLKRLAGAGARVAVLSHQGEHSDGSALALDFVADYLSRCFDRPVRYHPTCVGTRALQAAHSIEPGEIAVFGNTRHHAGEQSNDPALAKAFAALGDVVAIGGLSKAHRSHASNVGLLYWLPGYLADNVREEIDRLAPWAGEAPGRFSVAALGGTKREKTEVALKGMSRTYDAILPGGAVLHHLLRALGYRVGASELGDRPDTTTAVAAEVLRSPARERIFWPQRLVVATRLPDRSFTRPRRIDVGEPVSDDEAIVDCLPSPQAQAALARVTAESGRLLVAGPPSATLHGFDEASRPLLAAASAMPEGSIFLGGDTACELGAAANRSPGGGSALHYLVHGTLPILDALHSNAAVRRHTCVGSIA